MVDYEMEYITGTENRRKVCRIYAENDEEAVMKAKEEFLNFAEFNNLSSNSELVRVYRAPENLLKKVFGFSVKKGKNIFSLTERR